MRLNLVGFNYPREFMSALSSGPIVFPPIDVFNDSREVKWGNRAWKCAVGKLVAVFLSMRRLTNYPKIFSTLKIILFKIRNWLFSRSEAILRFRFGPVRLWERTYGSVFEPEDDESNVLNMRCDKTVVGLGARPTRNVMCGAHQKLTISIVIASRRREGMTSSI